MKICSINSLNCQGPLALSIKSLLLTLMILVFINDIRMTLARPNNSESSDILFRQSRIPKVIKSNKHSKFTKSPYLKMRTIPSSELVAVETSNQVLECEAGGSPSPTIHWLRDGEPIYKDEKLKFIDDKPKKDSYSLSFTRSRLYLDCVNSKDEATYTCVASTPYDRVSSSTNLKVVPNTNSRSSDGENFALCLAKKSYGLPARVNMWTHNRLEMIGTDVQLFCRSSGIPKPVTSWIGPDDNPIINGEKYQILENGDLLIKDLSWDDMGNYYCTSSNQHGNDKISMFLYPTLPEKSK